MLTETLRSRPEWEIRSYAYVPDSMEPGRGEARNFLRDVVVGLERAGFRVGESIPGADRVELSRRLHLQFERLHQEYVENGRRTIILIDGLDHIDREKHPERSLLRDLPNPDQIPDGVLFLLGSQTSQLPDLPPGVELQIREPTRRVEMQPLSGDSTLRMLDRADIPFELCVEQSDRFVERTEGHPLSIEYLLNQHRADSDGSVAGKILEEEVGHGGDIRIQYHGFWRRRVEGNSGLAWLLGLLACHRGAIPIDWLTSWVDGESLRLLRDRVAHYFRVERDRWHFYHNSFRQFLLEGVVETSSGMRQVERVRQLHAELAARSAASPRIERRWEEFYHLMMAGDRTSALRRASQRFFRVQFFVLRPPSLIRAGIELAIRIAAEQRDVVSVGRLLLAFVECGDRETYLEDVPLRSILIELGEVDQALVLARDGHRLLVGSREGLGLAQKLAARGHLREARQLFELAEPLDSLFSADEIEIEYTRGQRDVLSDWARAATLFRPVDEVLATISSLRFRSRFDRDQDPATFTVAQRTMLVFHVGMGLLGNRRWDEARVCIDRLGRPDGDRATSLWLRLRLVGALYETKEIAQAIAGLEAICTEIDARCDDVGVNLRLSVAETCLLLESNEGWAHDFAQAVVFPKIERQSVGSDSAWEYFEQAFRLGRLLFLFGDRRTTEEIAPIQDDAQLRPTTLVLWDVLRMARMTARAKRGEVHDRSEIDRELQTILRRFSFNRKSGRERHLWLAAYAVRDDLYALLVRIAAHMLEDWLER